ncbi:MAG: cohesin domain-containing protein [Pseudomonadota bacterium]
MTRDAAIRMAVSLLFGLIGVACSPDLGNGTGGGEDSPAPADTAGDVGTDLPRDGEVVKDLSQPDGADGGDLIDENAGEAQPCDPGDFCDDKACGPDPCGGQCKTTCWAQQECFAWKCRDEGQLGFPCEVDGDCDDGHCVPWEDGFVCTVFCENDGVCEHPDWDCALVFGSTFCMPPCEPLTCEALDAACGAPEDGCSGALDCGTCEGENEACSDDWTCACAYVACGDLCCAAGEECVDGACWDGPVPCDPACDEGHHCTDLGLCAPCCTFGEFCGDGAACAAGLDCNGGTCCFPTDGTCDGVDDDCDGIPDDDYLPDATCGVGPCLAFNTASSCLLGVETPCQPGPALGNDDAACDGVDDDCDGQTDEDYVSDASCGEGPCQSSNTPSSCVGGAESPCQPGPPAGDDDSTCDGLDDDCDGATDEDYPIDDQCGVGWCQINNLPSACVDGFLVPCQPGEAGNDEATCNGVDDDCDGFKDEDVLVDASCGVGACHQFNSPSTCVGGVAIPCVPGEAAIADTICNGLDDDCDGDTDEDYLPDDSCGTGWCLLTNVASACIDGVNAPCVPGQALAELDVSCDSVDSDCDGQTDEDANPPCSFGAPVVGADVVFLSDFGLPSGMVTDHGNGSYSTMIIGLFEPGLEGTVTAHVGEKTSSPKGFTVVSGIPEATTLHLSRDLVYGDTPQVRACLYTTDALGAPAGPGFEAGFGLVSDEFELSADATYAGAGFYCGWIDLPSEAFATWGEGQITGWIEALTSDPQSLTIAAAPVFAALDVGEVAISIPLGPVAVGQEFSVPVVVNTGTHLISAYNLGVNFDPTVLEVVSLEQGAAVDLSPPASNAATDANEIGKLSFNAINQNPAGGTAQGEAVEVALITFAVRADAIPGASGAISGDVHELIDTLMADFSESADMTVRGPDGSSILDVVQVDQVVLRTIQPVATPPILLDMSVLTGEVPTGLITVLALRSDGSLSLVSDSEDPICEVDDPTVVTGDGCLLTSAGPGVTSVTATLGGLSGTAYVRVATLETPLSAAPLDPELQYVFELDVVQSTTMRVTGTLSDGELLDYSMDLTAHADFHSSDEVVAAISGDGHVTPGINGAVDIDVLAYDGTTVATSTLEVVGSEGVQVDDLLVVVPAHVEMASLVPDPIQTADAATTATAKVTNLLSGEGHQVQTRAILIFSDDAETDGGSRLDITGTELLEYQSGTMGIGTVDGDGVITAVGAGETEVYAVFTDVWGDAVADDTKPFSVELPPPVSVEVSVADPRVAIGIEDRAWTVLGVPHKRSLVVKVFFEDGTSLSLAQDPRTHYEVSGNVLMLPGVVDCLGVPGCEPGVAEGTGTGAGTVTVTVTFPNSYLSDLVGTIDLEVVAHEELILASHESHTPADSSPVAETILSLIEGTGLWQDAVLRLVDTFSDGSQVILTEHPDTEFHVYMPGTNTPATGIILVSNDGRITAQGNGIVNLVGEHQGTISEPIPLQVSGSSVNVIGITAYLATGTLLGVKDQGNETLVVRGQFSDGTRRLLSGAGLVPGLLTFESMDPDIATISSAAVLTARGNGHTVIIIDVNGAADIGVPFDPPSLSAILVNLQPTVGDVDLGEPVGHPFPDRLADAIFEVPVRVNTGGFLLGGLDVEIAYDPDVLEALGVVPGLSLPAAVLHGNTGEPGKIYLNVSPLVGKVAFGDALEVGRIVFMALKSPGGGGHGEPHRRNHPRGHQHQRRSHRR